MRSLVQLKMANSLLTLIICVTLVPVFLAHEGEHDPPEKANETPQDKSSVKVNVPNFLNILPDFDKLFKDFDFGSEKSEDRAIKDTPIRSVLKNVRTNYKNVRGAVQSALNLQDNETDLLDLELTNKGSKTQMDIKTPLGKISFDGRSPNKPRENLADELASVIRATEKPFNAYMTDLIKEHSKRFDDFTLNILGPRQPDGFAKNLVSVSNKNDRTSVDVTAPILPVRFSMASQGFSPRSGWVPTRTTTQKSVFDENWDPQDEYNEQINHQKQKYMDLRSHEYSQPQQPHTTSYFPSRPHVHHTGYRPHDHNHYGHSDPHFHSHASQHSDGHYHEPVHHASPWVNQYHKREGHSVATPYNQQPIMSNLPVQNYQDHRNMVPVFGTAGHVDSYSQANTLNPPQEEDTYEDYLQDLEEASRSLSNDSKEKLKVSFKEFRKFLDQEPEGYEPEKPSWLPRRAAGQRDLEIAFLNIDKDSDARPNPNDQVVVAFTLTGVPLKIYVDNSIKDPVGYLNKILADAGITLNIPVSSFDSMLPAGDVMYVGAGNGENDVTQAVTLEVQNLDDIKKAVRRFLVTNYRAKELESTKALTEALHGILSSANELIFPDDLVDNYRKNPVQVLADLVTFLSDETKDLNENKG